MTSHIRSPRSGFTLVELLVVIAIIGLLSSVVVTGVETARVKSRDAARQASVKSLMTALEMYRNDNGAYPASGGAIQPNGGWSNSNDASWATLQSLLAPHIGRLPADPRQTGEGTWPGNDGQYSIAYFSSGYGCDRQWYMIVWRPENASLAASSPGVKPCDQSRPPFNYTGTVTIGMSGRQ